MWGTIYLTSIHMRQINIRKKYFSNAFHNEMLKETLLMILEFFFIQEV